MQCQLIDPGDKRLMPGAYWNTAMHINKMRFKL